MNPHEADAALRDLFREAGGLDAPEGMDARVLQQLAGTPAVQRERPLLPMWAWGMGAALVVAAVWTARDDATGWIPAMHLATVLRSSWTLMTIGAGTLLFALHVWLNGRSAVARQRS